MTDTAEPQVVRRASHRGYVYAIAIALAGHGVQINALHVRATPARTAVMDITPINPVATMWVQARWLRLSWQERRGWEIQVRWLAEPEPRAPLGFHISAAPTPAELTGWVAMVLLHPDLDVGVAEETPPMPDLEEVLRRYTAPTAG